MGGGRRSAAARRDDTAAVRQHLDRVLSSETFRQAARLKRFLTFVVNEATAGRADQLKEYVIGVQVFDRESGFDPRTDPIVRVQARRLRSRLAAYYLDEGLDDELLIDLPKGGYAPTFHTREQPRRSRPAAHIVSQDAVVVLGFEDCSPGRDLGYICEGLRTELIHAITCSEGLRVVSAPLRPPQAAGEGAGDASAVHPALQITGSVRASGRRIRLTAHIIDSPTGSILSSDTHDGSLDDPLEAQEAIAAAVARRLRHDLAGRAGGRRLQRPVENLSARTLYLATVVRARVSFGKHEPPYPGPG
jgi:serine/threonine-protein kinase